MTDITIGARVRHPDPNRGIGTVHTIEYSFRDRKPVRAWVEFPWRDGTRRLRCWAADLAVVEAPVERPVFKLVEQPLVVA